MVRGGGVSSYAIYTGCGQGPGVRGVRGMQRSLGRLHCRVAGLERQVERLRVESPTMETEASGYANREIGNWVPESVAQVVDDLGEVRVNFKEDAIANYNISRRLSDALWGLRVNYLEDVFYMSREELLEDGKMNSQLLVELTAVAEALAQDF
ncbi:hypothetical protein ACFL5U_01380 [Candidatus Margulisiibacteriota bacterium]